MGDAFGEFHQIKRKTGAWVNWGMFYQVWVKVREVGKWQQGDYVVKADADAVFVPQRLREWLGSKGGDTPLRLLRELPQCAVRVLRQSGGDEQDRGLGSDHILGGLPCCLRPLRQPGLRLEVRPLG